MKMKKNQTRYLIILCIIIFGGSTIFAISKSDVFKQIAVSQKLINDVYKYIVSNYADELDIDKFTKSSIEDILGNLDPYTVFMEPEEGEGIDLLTKGKYGGVGMEIGKRDGKLTVIAPMDDSPTMRVGIISGDIIVKIDTINTEKLNLNAAAKLIRGEKGTAVTLIIQRGNSDKEMEFILIRDDIKIKDVAYTGMVNDKTGYILLTRFSRNSSPEMQKALTKLKKEKAESIILDLRNNPGGLLQSSIDILDMLLPKNQLLLSTKGRTKGSNRTFYSKRDPIISEDIKLAVLINGGSASASEIVSGTIQDLDRGVIIGNRSFGKGLVQSVYNLDDKNRLKMTTAKYYIPSGRLIQSSGYVEENIIIEFSVEDSLYHTSGGRIVEGGGGIMPDHTVDNKTYGPLTQECWRKGSYFTFVQSRREKYSSFDEVTETENLLEEFQSYIETVDMDIHLIGETQFNNLKEKLHSVDSTNKDLLDAFELMENYFTYEKDGLFEKESEDIFKNLLSEFANYYKGKEGRIQFNLKHDKALEKAISILEDQVVYNNVFRNPN